MFLGLGPLLSLLLIVAPRLVRQRVPLPLGWEPGAVASPPQLLAATVTAVAAVTIAAGLTVATLSCGRRRRGFKRVGAEDDEDQDGVERDDQLEYF